MRDLRVVAAAILSGGLLLSPPSQSQVGFIPGTFDVDQGGSATYTIPLIVPPGTAGMEPKLALTYSSQRGNGWVGMGWAP